MIEDNKRAKRTHDGSIQAVQCSMLQGAYSGDVRHVPAVKAFHRVQRFAIAPCAFQVPSAAASLPTSTSFRKHSLREIGAP
jgi:hypothetical protein